MTTVTNARPVAVDELKRAYLAVQAGTFRRHRHGTPPTAAWTPASPVLAVVGASSGSGASTVALALATAAGTTRLLECASTAAAGLTAAATAELGRDGAGWILGTRGPVRIERVADTLHGPHEVPHPTPGERVRPARRRRRLGAGCGPDRPRLAHHPPRRGRRRRADRVGDRARATATGDRPGPAAPQPPGRGAGWAVAGGPARGRSGPPWPCCVETTTWTTGSSRSPSTPA